MSGYGALPLLCIQWAVWPCSRLSMVEVKKCWILREQSAVEPFAAEGLGALEVV